MTRKNLSLMWKTLSLSKNKGCPCNLRIPTRTSTITTGSWTDIKSFPSVSHESSKIRRVQQKRWRRQRAEVTTDQEQGQDKWEEKEVAGKGTILTEQILAGKNCQVHWAQQCPPHPPCGTSENTDTDKVLYTKDSKSKVILKCYINILYHATAKNHFHISYLKRTYTRFLFLLNSLAAVSDLTGLL